MIRLTGALTALTLMSLAPAAFAEGDAEKGAKVFRKCAACHTVEADGPKRAGPNLHGVAGRVVGSLEGFAYSNPLKAAGEAGDVWSDEQLDAFLSDPKLMYKGHKMSFAGLKKADERTDLIAYLHAQAPAAE
ncbi:c-type cytochrome [Falsigemmobacter faecalis]|uniref:Cytochrome c family protein n=1 Tax=Falsigemmobacter faecalis TaxID=2488730 RepID=A0A3P3DDG8_9RHOB|nr:cytochrome c family protein [Falsigemmobacter faecalis]RRH72320.1 cytochrome c family protein [Falsigemmobacter faecalis]